MILSRLLHAVRGGPSDRRDGRSAEAVLDAAAARFDMAREPAVAAALTANNVRWASQLAEMEKSDWEKMGASIGLQTAAKAELADPTVATAASSADDVIDNERMRRFLLLPDADGKEAKPLREWSAMFLGLLATPAADRQMLMLALCEFIALISGLFLPLPLGLRRHAQSAAPWVVLANQEAGKGWDVPPTIVDWMDAVATFALFCDAMCCVAAVLAGVYVAAAGANADDRFCQHVMSTLSTGFLVMNFGTIIPVLTLLFWQVFTDSASPYPLIAVAVICHVGIFRLVNKPLHLLFLDSLALEAYHMPVRHLGRTYSISDKTIKERAERRAARLRAQMGIAAQGVPRAADLSA